MRVGFVQLQPVFGQKKVNLEKAIEFIQQVEADLLVLPELFNSGYLFLEKEELQNLAERIPQGETTSTLREIAKERKVSLVFGIAEEHKGKFFNSSVLLKPGGKVHIYRKLHLFFEEKLFFSPGNRKLEVIELEGAKVGMMVCFDWIFPEVARSLTLKGADIICHPANLILPHCQEAMRTRCIENRVFAITANRVGTESRGGKELFFTGKSQIVNPLGEVLTQASRDKEEVRVVEIDPQMARDKNVTLYNNLFGDRRRKFYKR